MSFLDAAARKIYRLYRVSGIRIKVQGQRGLAYQWYRIGCFLVRLLTKFSLHLDIHGKTSLPPGPLILVANHPSTIDPAVLTTLTREKVSILILDTLFKVPLFGRSLRWCGHIPVVEGDGRTAMEQASAILKSGGTLAIFPEGVICPISSTNLKPHTGMARLALRTGAPVVPIGISLDPACLRPMKTRVAGLPATGTWYFHGPYALTIGEPMFYRGNPEDRELVQQVGTRIMQRIAVLTTESSLRIQSRKSLNGLGSVPIRAFWYVLSRSLNLLIGSGAA